MKAIWNDKVIAEADKNEFTNYVSFWHGVKVQKQMSKLYIPVLAGTTREKRRSIYAARLVAEVGNTFDEIQTEVIDPIDYTFPGDGKDPENKDPKYTEKTAKAQGFFIVTPEYNHSIPGSLKRMLDSELTNYRHKPVAFGGVSSGPWGGVRAIEQLAIIVRNMGLVSTSNPYGSACFHLS